MTLEQKYKEQYEVGFPIFQKLFELNKADLIMAMKDIFYDNKTVLEILENNPRVTKTIADDEPNDINISFYGNIMVTYFGVTHKPEHGNPITLLKFDKFFNVDAALKTFKK